MYGWTINSPPHFAHFQTSGFSRSSRVGFVFFIVLSSFLWYNKLCTHNYVFSGQSVFSIVQYTIRHRSLKYTPGAVLLPREKQPTPGTPPRIVRVLVFMGVKCNSAPFARQFYFSSRWGVDFGLVPPGVLRQVETLGRSTAIPGFVTRPYFSSAVFAFIHAFFLSFLPYLY